MTGRSEIETLGDQRFEVVGEYGQKDGYSVATVRWIQDEADPSKAQEVKRLSRRLRELSNLRLQERGIGYMLGVYRSLGPQPEDDEALLYWALRANVVDKVMSVDEQILLVFGEDTRSSKYKRIKALLEIEDSVATVA